LALEADSSSAPRFVRIGQSRPVVALAVPSEVLERADHLVEFPAPALQLLDMPQRQRLDVSARPASVPPQVEE
jgi:hypothetical protein